MARRLSKTARAVLGLPFLGLAVLCFLVMDVEKVLAHQQPFLESEKIEFDGQSIPILKHFYYFDFLDMLWRGTTVTFSPSTLGYDSISSWQMFSFLHDLGPVYAVWFLESYRAENCFTPAYFPAIFLSAGQLLGIGFVAPIRYFLLFVLGPSPSQLARSNRGGELRTWDLTFLLPIILALHTAEVFAAFCSPTPEMRHYWTWAWQMAPLEIGFLNFIVVRLWSTVTSARTTTCISIVSPMTFLAVLSTVSSGVWLYTLFSAPHSISEIFVPDIGAHSDFISHTRLGLHADQISAFASCFLWLIYSLLDLGISGLSGKRMILPIALFSIAIAFLGPGSAFALGWYWKETLMQAGRDNASK